MYELQIVMNSVVRFIQWPCFHNISVPIYTQLKVTKDNMQYKKMNAFPESTYSVEKNVCMLYFLFFLNWFSFLRKLIDL